MTDQLRQAVGWYDRTAQLSRPPYLDDLLAAARAWSEFPTDAQVEAAARTLYELQFPDSAYEQVKAVGAEGMYLELARAALEAAHNHTNRKEGS